jgi:hypothetical protein
MPEAEITKVTRAEQRARHYAGLFTEIGWTVRVAISEYEPHLFQSGEIMIPARTYAHVTARGPEAWDSTYMFEFITRHGAPGHRESTFWAKSSSHLRGLRASRQRRSLVRMTERELASLLAVETTIASSRTERKAG